MNLRIKSLILIGLFLFSMLGLMTLIQNTVFASACCDYCLDYYYNVCIPGCALNPNCGENYCNNQLINCIVNYCGAQCVI